MLLILLLLPFVACHNVQEFVEDKFAEDIKNTPFVMVFFYAPWCGHCKQMKPIYDEVAASIPESREDITIAKVDCTVSEKTCSQYGIRGYPTLKFFSGGIEKSEYQGNRDKDSLVRFILMNSKSLVVINSSEKLQAFLDSPEATEQPVVTAYINPSEVALSKAFSDLTSQLNQYVNFVSVQDPSLLDISGKDAAFVLYRPKQLVTKLEDAKVIYGGEHTVSDIKKWILNTGYGLVGYRTSSNDIFFPKENLVVFYHNVSITNHLQGVNYHRNRLIERIKKANINTPALVYAYSFVGDFANELNEFTRDPNGALPIVAIYHKGKKYILDEYSPEAFVKFLQQFVSGSLTPFVKSESVPTKQDSAAIKIVGHNFDEIVNDHSKDVLVMFHAPWCGHCKKLMPVIEAVAETLKNEPNVLVVTLDATANDVPPPYEVKGYPTLYFVPQNKKDAPIRYEGDRDEAAFIKFIAKHSADKLSKFDREGSMIKEEL